jgi:integrase/recombinase XerD
VDPSRDSPLHGLKESFVQWTVAIGLSPETANIRKSALGHFIRWCHGREVDAPTAITRDLLEAYQFHLVEYRKANGDPLELSTQATRLNPIKAFCKWLVRNRLVESDPSRELILPRLPKRLPRRVPTVAEVRMIIAARMSPINTLLAGGITDIFGLPPACAEWRSRISGRSM